MTAPTTSVWLVAGYALFLVAAAWGFDAMAKRASRHAARWRTGKFVYRPDHDAWVCPQDQWLWPTSFDPHHRVMRYRASPVVCNSCPVKSTCTTSNHGREISREVDPWPHSDAGRFHRGIACVVAGLGVVMPVAMLIGQHSGADVLVLGGAAVFVVAAGLPLARHLWNTPTNAPEYLPHRSGLQDQVAAAIDRYSTQWGGGWAQKEDSPQ
ncbi:hypothetical protein [Mycobacterium noviomagense]|uniref:Transposase n=1 Tax=Mycobacterium noviomagense TaxID=459858 RepID=A0A7I7PHV1_9MYCO|nr:hypothetical protein [Mycobacterium noviomagense]ORB16863.1 hypothetical protein BST37_06155 [Mycobacterium noviomagense]BBY08218.1 hypothetical protein MNVI_35360 [Mycobacterium noviomagense]